MAQSLNENILPPLGLSDTRGLHDRVVRVLTIANYYYHLLPPRAGGRLDDLQEEGSSLPRSLQLPELDGGGAAPPAALR